MLIYEFYEFGPMILAYETDLPQVKRQAVGIWHCKSCQKTMAGGAWTLATAQATTVPCERAEVLDEPPASDRIGMKAFDSLATRVAALMSDCTGADAGLGSIMPTMRLTSMRMLLRSVLVTMYCRRGVC